MTYLTAYDQTRFALVGIMASIAEQTDSVSPDWSLAEALRDPEIQAAIVTHAKEHAHDDPTCQLPPDPKPQTTQ